MDSCRRPAHDMSVKDLSKSFLDFSLKDFILVDHSAIAFQCQLENGILMKRLQGDLNDRELYKLLDFYHVAAMCKDARKSISTYLSSTAP